MTKTKQMSGKSKKPGVSSKLIKQLVSEFKQRPVK